MFVHWYFNHLFSGLSNGAGGKPSPQFDTPHLDNHTVQLGAIAFLPCTIKNLGNRSVSKNVFSDSLFIVQNSLQTYDNSQNLLWFRLVIYIETKAAYFKSNEIVLMFTKPRQERE